MTQGKSIQVTAEDSSVRALRKAEAAGLGRSSEGLVRTAERLHAAAQESKPGAEEYAENKALASIPGVVPSKQAKAEVC